MRRFVLALLAAGAVGLAVTAAQAQGPYRRYHEPIYAPNYGYQVNNYYRGWSGGPYYSGTDPHGEAVRRIMAAHSRYRYYTHPRALHNSPPRHADYFGWE